jgi:hypothetical protein
MLASEPCPISTPGCVVPTDSGSAIDSPTIPMNDSSPGDAAPTRSPFCGVIGCFPGNPSACGATPEGDAAVFTHVPQIDDAAPEDGQADHAPPRPVDASSDDASRPEASVGGDGAADVSLDASSDAGDVGAGDEPRVQRSCYVRPADNVPGTHVATECAPVGQGAQGSACQDSSDCGALLACVEVDTKPTCWPFSCALPTSCPSGSYYQLEPLRVGGATMADLKVPVCLPTDHCDLRQSPSKCPSGRVCAVVGSEGDTTCIVPGTAKLGDPCDDLTYCAQGLVCAKLKNQCLKMCRTSSGPAECPGGTCQGGNLSLPDGFGICVGTSPDAG